MGSWADIEALAQDDFAHPGQQPFADVGQSLGEIGDFAARGFGIWLIELGSGAGFLADFAAVPGDVLRRARIMIINYPNNPTGVSMPLDAIKIDRSFIQDLLTRPGAVAIVRACMAGTVDLYVLPHLAELAHHFGQAAPVEVRRDDEVALHRVDDVLDELAVIVGYREADQGVRRLSFNFGFSILD